MKEAYVSYEVAKLLKEKGFDWECNHYYMENISGDEHYLLPGSIMYGEDYNKRLQQDDLGIHINVSSGKISAPNQQMACRWLREEHNIHIMPTIGCDVDRTPRIFYGAVIVSFNKNGDICYHNPLDENYYNEPEDAVEAALEYVLKNLI